MRPHVVTNKKLIRNALIFVCLAGEANITTKQRALAVRQDIPSALYLFLPTLSPSPLRSWTHLGLVTSWYSSVTHSAVSSKLSMATSRKMTRWDANNEREGEREGASGCVLINETCCTCFNTFIVDYTDIWYWTESYWNQYGDQVLQVSCMCELCVCTCVHACMCAYVFVCTHACVWESSSCTLISLLTGIIQVVRNSDQFILISSPSSLMLSLFTTRRKDSP